MEDQSDQNNQDVALVFINEVLSECQYHKIYEIIHEEHEVNVSDSTTTWTEPQSTEKELDHYESLIEIIKFTTEIFSNIQYKVNKILSVKNSVAVFCTFKGKQTGELDGYPPTGIQIKADSAFWFEFKENKILKISYVVDTLSINHQIGRALIKENDEIKIDQYIENLKNKGLLPLT